MKATELREFIREKIAQTEKSLRARLEMEAGYRSGTDASWAAAAKLHPSTVKEPFPKSERIKESQAQGRIAVKLQHELKMFNAVYEALRGSA